LEVSVRQATVSPLGGATPGQLPIAEILVVFCVLAEGCSGAGFPNDDAASAVDHEAVARMRLRVDSVTEEVHGTVHLSPGSTYAIEATAISPAGLQSAPVTVLARVPLPQEGLIVPREPDEEARMMSTDAEDEITGHAESSTSLDAEDEPAKYVCQRRVASPLRIGRPTFRGNAAEEYMAAASEKVRLSYEKTPYQLSAAKRHQQVELDLAWVSKSFSSDTGEHTVHRPVEDLDD